MGSLKSLFDLRGKVALITGGSRGLGLQIAEALGEFGAAVILVARKADALEAAAKGLADQGIDARWIVADLRLPGAVEDVVGQAVRELGSVDILVNNAGASWGAPAEDYPLEAWNKVFELNVTSLFALTQAVARTCFKPAGRGCVINVASIEGLQGHDPRMIGTIAYNAAKGAVVNMTRALAAEWGSQGIRVNALAPGFFPTKMTHGTLDAVGDVLLTGIPLGRFGGSDDLKGAALLLASDAGAYMTGHILVIDGGMTAI